MVAPRIDLAIRWKLYLPRCQHFFCNKLKKSLNGIWREKVVFNRREMPAQTWWTSDCLHFIIFTSTSIVDSASHVTSINPSSSFCPSVLFFLLLLLPPPSSRVLSDSFTSGSTDTLPFHLEYFLTSSNFRQYKNYKKKPVDLRLLFWVRHRVFVGNDVGMWVLCHGFLF